MQRRWGWRWLLVFWPGFCNRLAPGFLLPLLLIAGAGCRSTDNFSRIINEPAPLPESVRASFGKVGVLPPGASSDFVFEYPATRAQVMAVRSTQTLAVLAQGAWSGAGDQEHFPHHRDAGKREPPQTRPEPPQRDLTKGIRPGLPDRKEADHETSKAPAHHQEHSGSGLGDELGQEAGEILGGLLVIGAVSLVDGLAEALFTGVPKAEVKKSEAALRQVLRESPLQPGIQTCLSQLAAQKPSNQLVQIPDFALSTQQSQTGANEAPPALSGLGLDSLLVIRITKQGFSPSGSLNRSLCFVAEAEVRVTRISDGEVLHAGFLDYQSRDQKFTEWGANHAKRLCAELKQAQQTFAETILEQLFAPGSAHP